jgi:hypothetical protein
LERRPNGYQVHDYLDFNDSAETVRKKREEDRRRKLSERNPAGIQPESERNPTGVLARAPASHPIPSYKEQSKNKLVREDSPHTTSGDEKLPPAPLKPKNGNGQTQTTARSKRPIFTGQRLTVFEFMLDDCMKTLGPLTDAFDLHAWFDALDAELVVTAVVIPKRDGGVWLHSQLLAEAERRGLPIAVATPPPSKRSAQLAHMVATIAREEAEKRAAHK